MHPAHLVAGDDGKDSSWHDPRIPVFEGMDGALQALLQTPPFSLLEVRPGQGAAGKRLSPETPQVFEGPSYAYPPESRHQPVQYVLVGLDRICIAGGSVGAEA